MTDNTFITGNFPKFVIGQFCFEGIIYYINEKLWQYVTFELNSMITTVLYD